jgi:hypothetical protein
MLDLRLVVIAAFSSFFIGSVFSWWVTSDYKNAKHQQIIAEMYVASTQALLLAQQKALDTEREHIRLATEIEVQHVQTRQTLDLLGADNARLISESAGLYDRHSSGSGSSQCSAPSSPAEPVDTSTRTKLSNELTQFLLSESRRADEAASYAQTCYAWIEQINLANTK